MFKAKYQAHKLVNYIFYIIVFFFGFLVGIGVKKINFRTILSNFNFLMIENVEAFNFPNSPNVSVDESYIYNILQNNCSDFDISNYSKIYAHTNKISNSTSSDLYIYAFSNDATLTIGSCNNSNYDSGCRYELRLNTGSVYRVRYNLKNQSLNYCSVSTTNDFAGYIYPSTGWKLNNYQTLYGGSNFDFSSLSSSFNSSVNVLDFNQFLINLDAQVNTWNGYGYDFYTNQVGILDMRTDTYIVSSHTCPNDGDFVGGYYGDTNDICLWSYYNDLSDFLVFYFNGRIYDSENVVWSDITFFQGHTYSLSFTLYGLVPQEQLYSIQFSHEGDLNQEIYSSSFSKVLVDSLDEKTYLTFSITPTEDITFDHFFLKYFTNGSYAQTVGASRLWVYNDYTNLSDEAIQIIQTDKILSQNQSLKDLINNPYVNSKSIDDFWDYFEHKDFGLTQIITIPISTIQKISNGTCYPYNITILGKTIQLPCGNTIFWDREDVSSFKTFWNMFFGGILCYGIGRLIYKDIHKAQNPFNDKLEVIDL